MTNIADKWDETVTMTAALNAFRERMLEGIRTGVKEGIPELIPSVLFVDLRPVGKLPDGQSIIGVDFTPLSAKQVSRYLKETQQLDLPQGDEGLALFDAMTALTPIRNPDVRFFINRAFLPSKKMQGKEEEGLIALQQLRSGQLRFFEADCVLLGGEITEVLPWREIPEKDLTMMLTLLPRASHLEEAVKKQDKSSLN